MQKNMQHALVHYWCFWFLVRGPASPPRLPACPIAGQGPTPCPHDVGTEGQQQAASSKRASRSRYRQTSSFKPKLVSPLALEG